MVSPQQTDIRNRLLRVVAQDTFAKLIPHLEFVELPVKHVLVEADVANSHVYFLEGGLASVVASTVDDEAVEVGHVGHEGLAGQHVLMMTQQTPTKTFMQAAGSAYQVPVSAFLALATADLPFQHLLLRYVHSCGIQLAHSALANARYNVYERLARWLLMCHDRLGDELPLTHEFLSIMLGVRRSGVTDQLHLLEGTQAIKARRGHITVRDRSRLEEIASGCYGVPEREYERLVGTTIRQ
ncbi:Crp/Fnr family transcriptional regulator [Neorhizobium sp. T25_27]|uniref:Crp/Fnr family transcriptional regulator n=1 Tax=Neorhizobium sp. T25_27 TaxID=2093831 RepID=UPI000CF8F5D1|nr:Crp/Fnr family transcriptional regulator [Neorhizobium sp. T25_27]